MGKLLTVIAMFAMLLACSSWGESRPQASVQRGEYLAGLLGCGRCHTDGELVGKPVGEWLAGSSIGIAYTPERDGVTPGIVFPGNLTSDPQTGLGRWSKSEIVRMIRYGIDKQEHHVLPVMPWPSYRLLSNQDLSDIVDYLMSLPPVRHRIPSNIAQGEPILVPYVRFGVYQFQPGRQVEEIQQPLLKK